MLIVISQSDRQWHWSAKFIDLICMYEGICNVPLLLPEQSRVRTCRPNRKDVSLACYRKVSMSVLDHELTVADSSTVFGAQAAKLRGPKLVVRQTSTTILGLVMPDFRSS